MRKAIVMAGGQGSRLRPLTLTRPKPMLPVANRPVLAHILEWLRGHGFSDVLMTLHYRAEEIRRAFGDGRSFGVRITYRVEEQPLGTAGAGRVRPPLVAGGLALFGQELDGYWCDIGSMNDYRRGQRDALEGVVHVTLPGTAVQPGVWHGPQVWIAPEAVVEGPALLGAGCRIERGARVLAGRVLGLAPLLVPPAPPRHPGLRA